MELINKVPKTDVEVIVKLKTITSEQMQECAIGIYECKRLMGTPLIEAYAYTLESILGKPHGNRQG